MARFNVIIKMATLRGFDAGSTGQLALIRGRTRNTPLDVFYKLEMNLKPSRACPPGVSLARGTLVFYKP